MRNEYKLDENWWKKMLICFTMSNWNGHCKCQMHTHLEVQCIGTAVIKATHNEEASKMVLQFNSE